MISEYRTAGNTIRRCELNCSIFRLMPIHTWRDSA